MNDINPSNLAAPCGIYCTACQRCSETDLCRGCRADTRHNTCDIYECCVTQSGKNFCYECEYFPCERLKDFVRFGSGKSFAHYRHVAIDNLIYIRDNGVENWTEMMNSRINNGSYCINKKNADGSPDASPCPCTGASA